MGMTSGDDRKTGISFEIAEELESDEGEGAEVVSREKTLGVRACGIPGVQIPPAVEGTPSTCVPARSVLDVGLTGAMVAGVAIVDIAGVSIVGSATGVAPAMWAGVAITRSAATCDGVPTQLFPTIGLIGLHCGVVKEEDRR